ncbi:MAG: universal stress protein [Solirubrobacteraceae bacterium]
MVDIRSPPPGCVGISPAARARVAEGKSWGVICDLADELDAELIVIGARGLSRVRSALPGSVSSAVVVHARQPVLLVSAHVASER